jgi:lysophospholipase L1-like esterase
VRRGILQRVAIAAVSLIVALGLGEATLRAVGFTARLATPTNPVFPWVVYDPVLGRTNQPGFDAPDLDVRIDARGFRGPEVTAAKPPGVTRIVSLGDSTTFGIWQEAVLVGTQASYPGELARLLADEGLGRVEVINAGVLGYTSAEGLAQLLTAVLPLEPDVVTLRFGNNDHLLQREGERAAVANELEYQVLRRLPAWATRLEVVRLAFHVYRRAVALRERHDARFRIRVPLEEFDANLRRMIALAHERGVRVLLLDFPYRPPERGASPGEKFPNFFTLARSFHEFYLQHAAYQATVERVAREMGTPLLHTRAALWRAHEVAFTDFDLSHPNAAGARIVAEELRRRLGELGWLPPVR